MKIRFISLLLGMFITIPGTSLASDKEGICPRLVIESPEGDIIRIEAHPDLTIEFKDGCMVMSTTSGYFSTPMENVKSWSYSTEEGYVTPLESLKNSNPAPNNDDDSDPPTEDSLNLKMAGMTLLLSSTSPVRNVSVYDSAGRQVCSASGRDINEVDLSRLSAGIYTLKVGNQTMKFML